MPQTAIYAMCNDDLVQVIFPSFANDTHHQLKLYDSVELKSVITTENANVHK